jgi:hypothetical protein
MQTRKTLRKSHLLRNVAFLRVGRSTHEPIKWFILAFWYGIEEKPPNASKNFFYT